MRRKKNEREIGWNLCRHISRDQISYAGKGPRGLIELGRVFYSRREPARHFRLNHRDLPSVGKQLEITPATGGYAHVTNDAICTSEAFASIVPVSSWFEPRGQSRFRVPNAIGIEIE